MRTSQSIANIATALLKSQSLMGGAKKGAANPYFKSRYADLGAVLEACKELLNENGITILQPHSASADGRKYVETILLHSSGEWIAGETEIVCAKDNDPQAQGSAITYARRYGLQSLLSMPAEDDDGESAMDRRSLRQEVKPDGKTVAQGPPSKRQDTKKPPLAEAVSESDEIKVPSAPSDQEGLLKMISERSLTALSRKMKSQAELVEMIKKFGVGKKEELSLEQATELCNELGKVIYGKTK